MVAARELIPTIRMRLAEVESGRRDPLLSGRRAAFWRAQQHAVRSGRTVLAEVRRAEMRPRRR